MMSRSIGDGAGEPVQLGHDEHVTASAGGERFAKSGAITVGPGQAMVDVDAFWIDTQRGERIMLSREVLIDCGHSGVADLEFGHPGQYAG